MLQPCLQVHWRTSERDDWAEKTYTGCYRRSIGTVRAERQVQCPVQLQQEGCCARSVMLIVYTMDIVLLCAASISCRCFPTYMDPCCSTSMRSITITSHPRSPFHDDQSRAKQPFCQQCKQMPQTQRAEAQHAMWSPYKLC